jgi:hypothetical protein
MTAASVNQCSALVSRHITRNLGKKIGGRVKLSPAAMEATHDIDFVLWCMAPRKPIRVYAQEVRKIMGAQYNVPDCVWIVVSMDDGTRVHHRRRLGTCLRRIRTSQRPGSKWWVLKGPS